MAEIRSAREGDRGAVVSISIRTIRASYTSFLGEETVEKWLAEGSVEAYFEDKLSRCSVIEASRGIVGFSVSIGALIDLMMIDCKHHREGFGRALLEHTETELFATHSVLTLESFRDNRVANAFYAARGWTRGEAFDDPTGIAMIRFAKRRARKPA